MTWKEYIESRSWYRGALATEQPLRKRRPTYWTPDKKLAKRYADPHRFNKPMQLITAKIKPTKPFIGNDPAIARKLGLTKQHEALQAKHGKYSKQSDDLLIDATRKAGYDIQVIQKDQLLVFKPSALKIIKITRIDVPKPRVHLAKSRGVFADTKGQRMSRRPHRHWRKIY